MNPRILLYDTEVSRAVVRICSHEVKKHLVRVHFNTISVKIVVIIQGIGLQIKPLGGLTLYE